MDAVIFNKINYNDAVCFQQASSGFYLSFSSDVLLNEA